eukprot:3658145-Prymnesium_polylepis.1
MELRQLDHRLRCSCLSREVNRQAPTTIPRRHPIGVELRQLEHLIQRSRASRGVDRQRSR